MPSLIFYCTSSAWVAPLNPPSSPPAGKKSRFQSCWDIVVAQMSGISPPHEHEITTGVSDDTVSRSDGNLCCLQSVYFAFDVRASRDVGWIPWFLELPVFTASNFFFFFFLLVLFCTYFLLWSQSTCLSLWGFVAFKVLILFRVEVCKNGSGGRFMFQPLFFCLTLFLYLFL